MVIRRILNRPQRRFPHAANEGAPPAVIDHLKTWFSEVRPRASDNHGAEGAVIGPIICWRILLRVTADQPNEGLRVRRCLDPTCNALFTICASCDRGQRYCSGGCRKRMRQQQMRASSRRYQASAVGKENHCQRQRSYRQRRCQPRVTHQGPVSITTPRQTQPINRSQCLVCGCENRWTNPFDGLPRRRRYSPKKSRPASVQISTFSDDR